MQSTRPRHQRTTRLKLLREPSTVDSIVSSLNDIVAKLDALTTEQNAIIEANDIEIAKLQGANQVAKGEADRAASVKAKIADLIA